VSRNVRPGNLHLPAHQRFNDKIYKLAPNVNLFLTQRLGRLPLYLAEKGHWGGEVLGKSSKGVGSAFLNFGRESRPLYVAYSAQFGRKVGN
jgi:hypothetical protein